MQGNCIYSDVCRFSPSAIPTYLPTYLPIPRWGCAPRSLPPRSCLRFARPAHNRSTATPRVSPGRRPTAREYEWEREREIERTRAAATSRKWRFPKLHPSTRRVGQLPRTVLHEVARSLRRLHRSFRSSLLVLRHVSKPCSLRKCDELLANAQPLVSIFIGSYG